MTVQQEIRAEALKLAIKKGSLKLDLLEVSEMFEEYIKNGTSRHLGDKYYPI